MRRTQNVSTLGARKKVTLWMIKCVASTGREDQIAAKAVAQFPLIFRVLDAWSQATNRKKARDWWLKRGPFMESLESHPLSLTSRRKKGVGVQKLKMKALPGRGPKRHLRVVYEYSILLEEEFPIKYQVLRTVRAHAPGWIVLSLMSGWMSQGLLIEIHRTEPVIYFSTTAAVMTTHQSLRSLWPAYWPKKGSSLKIRRMFASHWTRS